MPRDKKELPPKVKMLLTILVTLVVTMFVTVLILNLRASEKQIRFQLTHRFAVTEPQFIRTMGSLLGPGIVGGNRITALQNGDEIFPEMLQAIHGARATQFSSA